MEILVRHTITLDPAVIELLKGFSGGQQAPVKEMTASPAKASKAQKTEPVKEEVKETPPAQAAAPEATAQETAQEISFTDIRQLYLEKKDAGKQEKVKAILDEYGVKKLSEFKPDQFKEVYDKIKAA
jgi:hypothetical protein